jgi:hypothetical protein
MRSRTAPDLERRRISPYDDHSELRSRTAVERWTCKRPQLAMSGPGGDDGTKLEAPTRTLSSPHGKPRGGAARERRGHRSDPSRILTRLIRSARRGRRDGAGRSETPIDGVKASNGSRTRTGGTRTRGFRRSCGAPRPSAQPAWLSMRRRPPCGAGCDGDTWNEGLRTAISDLTVVESVWEFDA